MNLFECFSEFSEMMLKVLLHALFRWWWSSFITNLLRRKTWMVVIKQETFSCAMAPRLGFATKILSILFSWPCLKIYLVSAKIKKEKIIFDLFERNQILYHLWRKYFCFNTAHKTIFGLGVIWDDSPGEGGKKLRTKNPLSAVRHLLSLYGLSNGSHCLHSWYTCTVYTNKQFLFTTLPLSSHNLSISFSFSLALLALFPTSFSLSPSVSLVYVLSPPPPFSLLLFLYLW